MWMGDPFLMLAEEHKRDLYDDARHYALLREAGAGRRSGRTDGILGWIGRRLGIRCDSLRCSSSHQLDRAPRWLRR